MGTLFSYLTVRIALIVMGLISVSMTVATVIAGNQPLFDPFAPYTDILPGQPLENVLAHGFQCELDEPSLYNQLCLLTPETGPFSEIQLHINNSTGRVGSAIFTVPQSALALGNLARLWGKPQTKIFGQTVNFRWPNQHIVTVLQNYSGHFSYWLPITYVAFEAAK